MSKNKLENGQRVMIKEIISYFDLDDIKNNKSYFVARIIYSLLIALSFFLNSLLSFGTIENETYKDVFFREIGPRNIYILIIVFIGVFFIISALGNIYQFIEEKKSAKRIKEREIDNKKANKKVFWLSFGIILICWLPTMLSFVPGGFFDDTVEVLTAAKGYVTLSKHQSILYMYIIKLFVFVGETFFGDLNIGLALYSFIQAIIFILIFSTIITWLYKIGINKKDVALLIGFISIFKLFPIYGIAIWKDSLFASAITFLTYLVCKIWYSDGEELKKTSTIVKYVFISLIISFLRNNGQYIIIGTTFILSIYYGKKINKSIFKFITPIIIEIIVVGIVQGPVMKALGRESEFREMVGIPIQQICYVIAHDGNINDKQLEFINKIEKIENIKERYDPYNVDMIKYYEFNDEFLEKNKKEFIKVWKEVGIQNPKMYTSAYLLSTTGYWNLIKISYNRKFVKNYYYLESYTARVFKMIWQTDLIKQVTGISFRELINPNLLIPCAIFEAILFLSIVYIIKNKRYSNIIMFVPVLMVLATLLVATPIAFSLRYMFSLVIIIPFSLFFPIIEKENASEEKEEIVKKKKNNL